MARKARGDGPLYYKIGEACKALGIEPYVLRYWETEFPALSPTKSKSGQRVYSQAKLDTIQRIKELLYDEGYTIAGAKKRLEQELGGASEIGGEASETPGKAVPSAPVARAGGGQEIETFRHGIRQALDQTREILEILVSRS